MVPVDQPALLASLHRYFGHSTFRAAQEDLVRTMLDGQDLLAVMPTGSGKSLGFQLPAVLLPGITLVVSPLISLMKDQVDELNRRGVRAAAVHSQLAPEARREIWQAMRAGDLRLLYVAPERFASGRFLEALSDLPVARFVVDEAHCVSEWGHDFRPDYRRLAGAARVCRRSDGQPGRPPMAAFTATATPEVRDDIVGLLELETPRIVVAGFDRPNIHLRVRPVASDFDKHQLLAGLVRGRRALVYAATRRNAETAADVLRAGGVAAAAYHAGLPDAERTRVQDAFAAGTMPVVCATNAFGMGIDRPDVEVVVHVDIPGSIEAYYQEIGRAGRDRRPAEATLLWSYADVKTRAFLIDRGRDDNDGRGGVTIDPAEMQRRKELEHLKLRRMVAYADAAGCLRATILRYFGDPAAREPCGACGNCDRRSPLDEAGRTLVRKILAGIARAGERYGRRRIAAMLVGAVDELPEPLVALSTTGLLRDRDSRTIERWIDAACAAGLVRTSSDQYRTLSLTPLGRDVMAARAAEVMMAVPSERPPRLPRRRRRAAAMKEAAVNAVRLEPWPPDARQNDAPEAAARAALIEVLRGWRRDEARRRAVPPYVVLHDRTLLAIAAAAPKSVAALGAIPGIGPAKLAEYGDAIVSVVAGTAVQKPGP
jgi:ATP-dependent DNA helicase RecQ